MDETPAKRVAGNVRAEMARVRMSQHTLAGHLSSTQASVSRRLRGEVAFDVNEVAAMAALFGLSVSALHGPDVALQGHAA